MSVNMFRAWNDSLSNNTSDPAKGPSRVFVGNLKPQVIREDLFEIFAKYGEITAISINRQGYGFVQFVDEKMAIAALDENGVSSKGCILQVKQCAVSADPPKKSTGKKKVSATSEARARSRSPIPQRQQSSSRSPSPHDLGPRDSSPIPVSRSARPSRSSKPPRDVSSRESNNGDGSSSGYRDGGGTSGGNSNHSRCGGRLSPRKGSSSYSSSHRGHHLDAPRKPNDCEIVVMSKQQRDYAENVERRLKNLGLKVDVLFLKDEALLAQALDDLGLRGTLYACVVGAQHELHNSVTLNVLYGVPQEHRNMPVDDALKFLSQNFREHLERQRDRDAAHDEREVKFLLKLLIESRYISIREFDLLIQHLTKRRDKLIEEEMGGMRRAASPHRDPPPSHAMQVNRGLPPSGPLESASNHSSSVGQPALTIEQQNQQLHEQIRNLIGTPAAPLAAAAAPVLAPGVGIGGTNGQSAVATAAPMSAPPDPFGLGGASSATVNHMGQLSQQTSPFVHLNNPSVQEALDKLMKQGALSNQACAAPDVSFGNTMMPDDARASLPPVQRGLGPTMAAITGDREPFSSNRSAAHQSNYSLQAANGISPFENFGGPNIANNLYSGGYGGGYGNSHDRSPPRSHFGNADGGRY